MSSHHERGLGFGSTPGQEADVLRKRDVGREALSVEGDPGKLAELQLLPWVGEEPLGVVAARGLERLADFVDVVGVVGVVEDLDALSLPDVLLAGNDVEEVDRVVGVPDHGPPSVVDALGLFDADPVV